MVRYFLRMEGSAVGQVLHGSATAAIEDGIVLARYLDEFEGPEASTLRTGPYCANHVDCIKPAENAKRFDNPALANAGRCVAACRRAKPTFIWSASGVWGLWPRTSAGVETTPPELSRENSRPLASAARTALQVRRTNREPVRRRFPPGPMPASRQQCFA